MAVFMRAYGTSHTPRTVLTKEDLAKDYNRTVDIILRTAASQSNVFYGTAVAITSPSLARAPPSSAQTHNYHTRPARDEDSDDDTMDKLL
jgi:hypothetical protein